MVQEYNINDGDVRLSEHFSLHEFKSGDSDRILLDTHLTVYLELIFEKLNCSKINITSGYRTPAESVRVGGSENDAHTLGLACDIICYDSDGNVIDGKAVCCCAQDIGIQGIGYMGNAVHIDTREYGGYKNRHWWGDETNSGTVEDFHSYFNM